MGGLEERGGDLAREISLLPLHSGLSLGSDVGAVEGGVMSLFGTSVTVDGCW